MGPSSAQVQGGTPPVSCSQRRADAEYRSVTRVLGSGTSTKRAPGATWRSDRRNSPARAARSRERARHDAAAFRGWLERAPRDLAPKRHESPVARERHAAAEEHDLRI